MIEKNSRVYGDGCQLHTNDDVSGAFDVGTTKILMDKLHHTLDRLILC